MAQWLDAKVTKRIDWNDHLFSLRFRCADFPQYTPGQFTKVGIAQDNNIISRPYSLVSHPRSSELEIMAVPVEEGILSPKLHELREGDGLKVMAPATGFLVLNEVPDSDNIWLIATGTGVGPFLSILAGVEIWQRYKKVVLIYAARYQNDLAYGEFIQQCKSQHPAQFCYLPIVSREEVKGALHGRIPELLQSGEIINTANTPLSNQQSQVMLCGNPQMIEDAMATLKDMGLKKHLRRSPGQITQERYW
ncbi:ferredoxin--NADP reductase [Paraglaciecola mesophila]|uniref:ferredoxin--NADP(+) reductase n=1 Tax=Paraglaciecola mesophila TaxID=197222 RepID=A0ABU9SYB8_9ALTE